MGITYEGECQGDTVVWCENGELWAEECFVCGYDQDAGYYACLQ